MVLAALIITGLWIGGTDGHVGQDNGASGVIHGLGWRDSAGLRALGGLDALDHIAASWWVAVRGEAVQTEGADFVGAIAARPARIYIGSSDWQALVCRPVYPWPCEWALAVIYCESNGVESAWAMEWHRGEQWYFHGLWQIASRSPDPGLLAGPVYNTERAAEKYRASGTTPWPGCP